MIARTLKRLAWAMPACLLLCPAVGRAADVAVQDAYVKAVDDGSGGHTWSVGTGAVEMSLESKDGRFRLMGFKNKLVSPVRDYVAPATSLAPLAIDRLPVPPEGATAKPAADSRAHRAKRFEDINRWTVTSAVARESCEGGRPAVCLELSFRRGSPPVAALLRLVAYPRSAIIRQFVELENTSGAELSLGAVVPFCAGLKADDASELRLLTLLGASCRPDQGTIQERPVQDPFHHVMAGNGTGELVPWVSLQRRDGDRDGWFALLDQEGPWRMSVDRGGGGFVASAESFGCRLAPGDRFALPLVTLGVYRGDLDDMGRRVYDWFYEYLWDYTHHNWFARPLHLDEFHWYWSDKNWNLQEKFTARLAMVMNNGAVAQRTGMETLWDDIAWWENDAAGFAGPDFARTCRFFRKAEVNFISYFAGTPGLAVLHDKFGAWGAFQWRSDFCSWGRGNPGAITPAQVREFRDAHPRCSFHSCSCGGGYNHGFEVQRLADVNQMSDASPDPSNYYFSYLEPPDKWQNTMGAGEVAAGHYNADIHRRILTHVPSWFGRPSSESQAAVRRTVDIYHYLLRQGVAGRWSYMFHPLVRGDREYFYAQRTSYDRRRACIILKHRASGEVTIYPRGLLEDHSYVVGFDSKPDTTRRTGKDLMANGIAIANQAPGELVYLGLPHRPGSGLDKTPPTPPSRVLVRREVNVGLPGVSLYWSPGADDNWVSHYEVRRGGQAVGIATARTYYFDSSPGWDPRAAYAVRTVDGDGNASDWKTAESFDDEPLEAQVLGGHFDQPHRNGWMAETSADGLTFQPMTWVPPGGPGAPGSLDGYWQGAGTARVGRGWQQTSTSAQCVRAWTAPEAGTVRIIGRAMKEFRHRTGATLRVKILHGGKQVWPSEGWAEARHNDLAGCPHDLAIHLARGDTVRFVLDRGTVPADEILAWMPRIVYQADDKARPQLSVVRIACGAEKPYTDKLGNVWAADSLFSGGVATASDGPIQGAQPTATDQEIYCRGREGSDFIYAIPVTPGLYSIRLKFAELKLQWSFERPMNLDINGRRVLSNFDICQAVGGPRRGYEQVFHYLVPDGQGRFVLRFTGGWDPNQKCREATVQGIEVLPEIRPAVRIRCGSTRDFIDWNSFVWTADRCFEGGEAREWDVPRMPQPASAGHRKAGSAGKEPWSAGAGNPQDPTLIAFATPVICDQELYRAARTGKSFRYVVPVPPGLYAVHLKFAELWLKATGKRPMNIEVNGRRVWEQWDAADAAGQVRAAADLRVEDIVPDQHGRIVIQVSAAGPNDAILQAIEIE